MRTLALALLVLLCPGFAGAAQPCRLKVGWEEWFPLFYRQNGHFQGSEYQLLSELSDAAGCQLEFIEVPWIRALQQLRNGELDMLYGASRNTEREAFARFSKAYRQERMVLVVRAHKTQSSPGEVSLRAWLAEPGAHGQPRTLGLIRGFYYGDTLDPLVRAPADSTRRLEVRWDQQLHQVLTHGRIDGYLVEASVARARQAAGGPPVSLLGVSEQPSEPMHLMFSRQIPEAVVERFDRVIEGRTGGTERSAD
jgi:polar amino acid transport system substrate-binding protein